MQNEKTLQQMIREYEANMPPEIMELINKFDWKRELRTIVMQNQLMTDIGADLEESVYLMLLGVIKVSDVYERLIETHELSQDRVRKVLEEIEKKIFDVLHKKLTELDEKEAETVVLKAPSTPLQTPVVSNVNTSIAKDDEDRDTILAEIEKDEVDQMIVKPIVKPIIEPKSDDIKPVSSNTPVSSLGIIAPKTDEIKINTMPTSGVAKPFSLNTEGNIIKDEPKPTAPEIVKGIQGDPVASGLNKATVMSAPTTDSTPVTKSAGAPDPYREPIE